MSINSGNKHVRNDLNLCTAKGTFFFLLYGQLLVSKCHRTRGRFSSASIKRTENNEETKCWECLNIDFQCTDIVPENYRSTLFIVPSIVYPPRVITYKYENVYFELADRLSFYIFPLITNDSMNCILRHWVSLICSHSICFRSLTDSENRI